MGEWLRFIISLAATPCLLIDDWRHRHEFDDFIAEQKQRFADMAEGQ
jgi:hypothetical protein